MWRWYTKDPLEKYQTKSQPVIKSVNAQLFYILGQSTSIRIIKVESLPVLTRTPKWPLYIRSSIFTASNFIVVVILSSNFSPFHPTKPTHFYTVLFWGSLRWRGTTQVSPIQAIIMYDSNPTFSVYWVRAHAGKIFLCIKFGVTQEIFRCLNWVLLRVYHM